MAEESIYEIAAQEYDNLTEFLINHVFPAREEYERKHGNDKYKAEYGIASFDLLLQFSLLQIAVADGKIDSSEIHFIKDLFKHTSIVDFYRAHGLDNLTWEDFEHISVDKLDNLLKQSNDDISDIAVDFAESFLYFDSNTPNKDYLAALERSIYAFTFAVMSADGEPSDVEKNAGCLMFGVFNCLKDKKQKLTGKIKNGSPSEQAKEEGKKEVERKREGKSLKDFYQRRKLSLATTDKQVDYQDKEKGLVYIEVETEEGTGSGSGFVITESGLCFTCYHVVKGAKEIYVRLDDGMGHRTVKPAYVQYFDEDDDFAIIQIMEIERCFYFKLEDNYTDVKTGDEIAIYGFPYGKMLNEDVMDLEPTLTRGYVASKNKVQGKSVYYLDARSCPGNSGGPVFSLKTNKVIGYLCGSYGQDRANLVFCRSLTEFFDTVVNK